MVIEGRKAPSFEKLINGGDKVEVDVTVNYKAVKLFAPSK